jgi:hypothetical protein
MAVPDFNFSSIHIVESLGESEGEPGRKLKGRLDHIFQEADSIPVFFDQAFDEPELVKVLEKIFREVRLSDSRPILHFEVHGGPEGIELKNKTIVTWKRLSDWLSKFNVASDFNLLVIFSCCDGIHQINTLSTEAPSPFAAMVGCQGRAHTEELLSGFEAYYAEILASGSLSKAVSVLQMHMQKSSAEFVFFPAEKAFVMAASQVFLTNQTRNDLMQRLSVLRPKIEIKRALEGNLTPLSLEEMTKVYLSAEKPAMTSFWENFFCIKTMPRNRQRYDYDHLCKLAAQQPIVE